MREVETGDLRVRSRRIRTNFLLESLIPFLTVNFDTFQRDGLHETLERKDRWHARYHFMQSTHFTDYILDRLCFKFSQLVRGMQSGFLGSVPRTFDVPSSST